MKKINKNVKKTLLTAITLSVISGATYVKAEDAEVFFSINLAKPNLLFVLDNSGSMQADVSGTYPGESGFSGASRMDVMKTAVKAVLADQEISNVNIGLMRYGPGYNNRTFTNGGYDFYGEASTTNQNVRSHGIQGVTFPITNINALVTDIIPTASDEYFLPSLGGANEKVRDYFGRIIDSWQPSGGTPIVGSLYEAALYYRGEQMHYGQDNPNHVIDDNRQAAAIAAHPSTYLNDSQTSIISTNHLTGAFGSGNPQNPRNHATAPNYNSPIKSHCQSNYIVLMSDGFPTYYRQGLYWTGGDWSKEISPLAKDMQGNSGYSSLAQDLPDCSQNGTVAATAGSGSFRANSGRCGPELTKYLAENDNSSAYEDDQVIKTFSIGFGNNMSVDTKAYLKELATFDDPNTPEGPEDDAFFSAENPGQLVTSFRKILRKIGKPKDSLASPGYSVNVRSGLEHEDAIYIPLFSRKETALWSGNLKKFRLVDGANGKRVIQGKNNLNATDEHGRFTEAALDYWSELPADTNSPDGKIVEKSGVAGLLDDPRQRNLFTNVSSNDLSSPQNHLRKRNNKITSDMLFDQGALGMSNQEAKDYRAKLLRFIRGWADGEDGGWGDGIGHGFPEGNIPKQSRKHMGDMLHSEPLVVTYENGDQYIFAGTNEGYLHAFDTTTGEEAFAFMPKELLKNINGQFLNAGTQKDHKYGVDGYLTTWHDKNNGKRYLYFGLRRGGSSYYALDITNINTPKLAWMRSPDSGSDYDGMGQSWSPPYLAKVGTSSGEKEVVIISGGYDAFGSGNGDDRNKNDGSLEVKNAKSVRTATVGNDILILDAKTGAHEFSLSDSQRHKIKGSIPGGARILDTNYNKLIDSLYFADTAGSVWRLDLSEQLSGDPSSDSALTKMADFSNGSRKFYNEPDVVSMKLNGRSVFAILIGSGFRAHPLDKTIIDNFFVVLDKSPFKPLSDPYEPVTDLSGAQRELAEITITPDKVVTISTDNGDEESIKDTNKWGWKINLPYSGEKSLGTSITRNGVFKFTTLVPETLTQGQGVDQCAAPPTQAHFYAIDILTGHAGMDLDGDGVITDADIFIPINPGEIPGKPQVVVGELKLIDVPGPGPDPVIEQKCEHPVHIRVGKKSSQVTGYDTCDLESVYWSDPNATN